MEFDQARCDKRLRELSQSATVTCWSGVLFVLLGLGMRAVVFFGTSAEGPDPARTFALAVFIFGFSMLILGFVLRALSLIATYCAKIAEAAE
jgi:hypothetical protein